MDFEKVYREIMTEQTEIALATCAGGDPDVRIVNFICEEPLTGVVYFSSFQDNLKVKEFEINPAVAFTSVPKEGNSHVRVIKGKVIRSRRTIYDIRDGFVNKIPDYGRTIDEFGEFLVLFEIHFREADVVADLENTGSIVLA
ncbi:pyridoxamine 5'-phosphate oxidase family protein [Lachnospiraceae bacterium 54-53]